MNETEELEFINTKLIIYLKHLCDDVDHEFDNLPLNIHCENYVFINVKEMIDTFLEYVEDSLGKKPINRIHDILKFLHSNNVEIDKGVFKISKPIINNLFLNTFKFT